MVLVGTIRRDRIISLQRLETWWFLNSKVLMSLPEKEGTSLDPSSTTGDTGVPEGVG